MVRECDRSPRRIVSTVEQDAIVARHMRDLLRACPPTFDGTGGGLEAET